MLALAVPPSFAHALQHRPQWVQAIIIIDLYQRCPITGASGIVLLSRLAISSRSLRVFFHGLRIRACTSRPLSACHRSRYSSLHSFSLCNCGSIRILALRPANSGQQKSPLSFQGRTKSVIYSCGTTFICRCLTASTSVGMGHHNAPLPTRPLTEASGVVLLSLFAISSRSFGFFFAVC